MNEICFNLIIKNEVIIDEDSIIDNFLSFAESNHISIGGNISDGFCFCSEKKEISLSIKKTFVEYLSLNYCKIFKHIIFKEFDERVDEFVEHEKVIISSSR